MTKPGTREDAVLDNPIAALCQLSQDMSGQYEHLDFTISTALLIGALGGLLSALILITKLMAADHWGALMFLALSVLLFALSWSAHRSGLALSRIMKRVDVVARALRWDGDLRVPQGKDPVERLIAFLRRSDERVERAERVGKLRLLRPAPLEMGGGERAEFDAFIDGRLSRFGPERYQVYIKVYNKKIGVEDVERLIESVERCAAHSSSPPTRVIAIQTAGEGFDERALAYTDENWVEYDESGPLSRSSPARFWTCPVELFAETERGEYDTGLLYFG